MHFSYPTTMFESILAQMYVFLVLFTISAFYHEKYLKQKLQKISFYQKYLHLGENTFIHCSGITVVRIHVHVFAAAEYSETVCWNVNQSV